MITDETTIRGILSGKLKSEMPKEIDIRKLIEEMGLPFTEKAIKEIYHSIVVCAFGLGVARRDSQIKADLKILEKHLRCPLKTRRRVGRIFERCSCKNRRACNKAGRII